MVELETVYVSKLPVVVQLKPTVNVGIEKKKQFSTHKEGELFIVGPWVKKQGGTDLESQRQANCENMNAHLNWHADEVLEFILTLYNPLKVPLPLTKVEVFKQSSSSSSTHHPFLALSGDKIEPLEPQRKTQLSLKFRSIQQEDIAVSHVELTLFDRFRTRINFDQNGLNILNKSVNVSQKNLYEPLKKPYFIDI